MEKTEHSSFQNIPEIQVGKGTEPILPYRSPEGVHSEELDIPGTRLLVPRYNLFGIQSAEDYSTRGQTEARKLLDKKGVEVLYDFPVFVCAVPQNTMLTLAITDGHHRARYAGAYGIHAIPSIIYPPTESMMVKNVQLQKLNDRGGNHKLFSSVDEYLEWIDHGINEALASFRGIPDTKIPKHIPYTDNIEDLTKRFPSF